jgi:hypothetical protein
MKILFVAMVLAATPLVSHAETLDIKTGAWEVTLKTLMEGMPIPKEAMANMEPAQRARMEEAMRARSGKVNTRTHRSCTTQKDLDRGQLMRSEEPNCKRKVITQNARHLEFEEVCTGPEPSKSHFKLDAASAERYTGSIDMLRGDGKVHVDMSGRWLGATCKEGDDD